MVNEIRKVIFFLISTATFAEVTGLTDGEISSDEKLTQLKGLLEERLTNIQHETRGSNHEESTDLLSSRKRQDGPLREFLSIIGKEYMSTSINRRKLGSLLKDDAPNENLRSVADLYDMTETVLGESPFKFLKYGCYCGKGGSGTPVDALDACCKTHDLCYRQFQNTYDCSKYWSYFRRLNYKIEDKTVICLHSDDNCVNGQCACDSAMIECFKEHIGVYNDKYTGFSWFFWNDC